MAAKTRSQDEERRDDSSSSSHGGEEASSRLFVKNIPSRMSEKRLRDLFAKHGDVSDVRVVLTPDGESRRFGFVGFRTREDAAAARRALDHTFIGSARISVTEALRRGSSDLPRPWSKYSVGSSRHEMGTPIDNPTSKEGSFFSKAGEFEKSKTEAEDPRFREFLATMRPLAGKRSWEDSTGADSEVAAVEGVSASGGRKKVKEGSEPSNVEESRTKSGDAAKDPLGQSRISRTDGVDLGSDDVERVLDTGRIFLRNLAFSVTESDIRGLCEPFGVVNEVTIPLDVELNRPKGFALVTYMMPGDALVAMKALDGTSLQGRLVHVIPGLPVRESRESEKDRSTSFRSGREAELKNRSLQPISWNSLLLRSDTVLDAVAERFGIRKEELVHRDVENVSVRVGLSEALVIDETKKFLEKEGVNLSSLEQTFSGRRDGAVSSIERSNTVILVKNIPFRSTVDELSSLFSKYGSLSRVVMPPSNALALVEFLNSQDARKAFRALSYMKWQDGVPLYLEWAPAGTCGAARTSGSSEVTNSSAGRSSLQGEEQNLTVFVKNLHWGSTEQGVREVFEKFGTLRTVTIARKKDPRNPGQWVSMGFGFVEFFEKTDVQNCLYSDAPIVLDGHRLVLKLSDRKSSEKKPGGSRALSSKIVIKNLPFQAKRKEVADLFGAFGTVKSVRIPKGFEGKSRGFGFVEFLTGDDASRAMAKLSETHFYGRHLILQFAENEDSLEALREKEKKRSLHMVEAGSGLGQQQKEQESVDDEDDLSDTEIVLI